jgi:hypothetical protein
MVVQSAACAASGRAAAPAADFIVSTGDSSYWVTSDGKSVGMRGAPMLLAEVDGRFREIYVADDDHSYYDAVFLGQRMFSRDLIRGDSVELFADTLAPRMARAFARAHPELDPISPDDDVAPDPLINVVAELDVFDSHGPYVSYEYRTGVDIAPIHGRPGVNSHRARRGVLDIRTGKPVTLAALFGDAAATGALTAASTEWNTARDSLAVRTDERSRVAQRAISTFAFDASSFSLDAEEREPRVVFAVPGEAHGENGASFPLTPLALSSTAWWAAARTQLPTGPDSARHWMHNGVELIARSRGDTEHAELVLRDPAKHEWRVGVVTAPVTRVRWLDASVNAETRKALQKAFNDAALYGDDTRVASLPLPLPSRHGRVARTTS